VRHILLHRTVHLPAVRPSSPSPVALPLISDRECVQSSGPGTVAYAAPELLARGEASPAADMYSFGCVLWELLTLRQPWSDPAPPPSADCDLGTAGAAAAAAARMRAARKGHTVRIVRAVCDDGESLPLDAVPHDVAEAAPGVVAMIRRCFALDPAVRPLADEVYAELQAVVESM
jgi:serine/threonine protein kinase